jgi:hypothetical protein
MLLRLWNMNMSKKRVANKDISTYIDKLEIVEGSNIFTENSGKLPDNPETDDNHYIVYSYGWHFPMYIYCRQADLWYGNSDRYSVSTTKHQSQARPTRGVDQWLTTNDMKDMIQCGSTLEFLIARAKSVVTLRQRGYAT